MKGMILLLLQLVQLYAVFGLNDRPIIAVLAQKKSSTSNESYIPASYVKYLESAGARVVPVPHYFTSSEVRELFKFVNGVLLPGGTAHLLTSTFYNHAKIFWDLAIEANDKGNYFPIWGTCLGFQTLLTICAKERILSRRVANDIALPLEFTSYAKKSRMFKDIADKSLFNILAHEKVTFNHHSYGVPPETFHAHKSLQDFFEIISLNKDDVYGKKFISTVEARRYPIYGIQWHPEKNNFEFTTKYNDVPHSSNAVAVTQYVANFFVNEARKNAQERTWTDEMERKYLIYRYTPVHSDAFSKFEQIYYF